MITRDNLHKLLAALQFKEDGGCFIKSYEGVAQPLRVDVKNEHISYAEIGITVGRNTINNFSDNENFVELECIDRLLVKGYKPEHIELEPTWKLGHTQKGGYADIWIRTPKTQSGETASEMDSLLIIECKKPDEFGSAWKETLENGDQLFSYFQQEQSTKFLCLYTSDLDGNAVKPDYYLINVQDNEELLRNNPDAASYKEASNNRQLYRVWHDTYECEASKHGLFDDDIQEYHIGKKKFTVGDLVPVSNEEIKKKYNQFATILRKHNVGAKENAFDKLVNLFLAKVVDETSNPNDLHFYWKGTAYDDDFSLQDRLQRLYRDGMDSFLHETVTYIEDDEIRKAFRWYRKDPDATMKTVMGYFRALKFFSDNDFSFISVHNERLFKENAKILREVLLMLQNMKLKSTGNDTETNQFLGDLFEGFLTKGVKQSEGQYFTPMPIVRFIVSSLPLEQIISQSEDIPSCIDYACGAGHFLTEYAVRIREFVEKRRPDADIHEYYKHITGIEKEYRLSKVSKVSAFMYGHDETNIIYADALQPHESLRPQSYDVLIANPPYSVTGFLETLGESDRAAYSLFNPAINVSKNNAIETFFMERAAQLLKAGGVAGIILPVSVLNKGGIYAHARQIILETFDIVALVEFGSGTFGKTGTNTVVMFLRRKETNTPAADHYRNRVKTWFAAGDNADDIYEDESLLTAYCAHCGYDVSDYKEFLQSGTINERLAQTEVFGNYKESFDSASTTAMKGVGDSAKNIRSRFKSRSKTKTFRQQPEEARRQEKDKAMREFAREIEKEKVYLFLLAHTVEQPILLVKTPSQTAEIKQFLGYEWSDRNGNEGIQYLHVKSKAKEDDSGNAEDDTMQQIRGISDIRTPLFDPADLDNPLKINTLIRRNFLGERVAVPEELAAYVSQAMLTDMIDFKRTAFDKALNTSANSSASVAAQYRWETTRLEKLLLKVEGGTPKIPQDQIRESGATPVVTQESDRLVSGYTDIAETVTDLPLIVFGDHACTFKYVDFEFVRGADGTQLLKVDGGTVNPKYLYHFLSHVPIKNASKYERHMKYLKAVPVPVPPLSVQRQIVAECEAIDGEVNASRAAINEMQRQIEETMANVQGETRPLRTVAPMTTARISYAEIQPQTYISTDNLLQDCGGRTDYEGTPNIASVIAYKRGDILVSNIRPYLKKIWFADCDGGCNPDVLVFHPAAGVLPQYVYYAMHRQRFFDHVMTDVKGMKMPRGKKEVIEKYPLTVPTLEVQRQTVAAIAQCEARIRQARSALSAAPAKKQSILDKYLK